MTVLARFYKISNSPVRYMFTWPIGAALCVGMLISAIGKTLGLTGTAWRGRVYTAGAGVSGDQATAAAARRQARPASRGRRCGRDVACDPPTLHNLNADQHVVAEGRADVIGDRRSC